MSKLPAADPKLARYITAAADAFPIATREVKEALDLLVRTSNPSQNAQALQLLALRRYLRLHASGVSIRANWAWTPEAALLQSSQGMFKVLLDEAAKVQAAFAAANPGYTLATSPLRNLQRQVQLWNNNRSVQRAADRLQADMLSELRRPVYANVPTAATAAQFGEMLRKAPVNPEPTSAAPGTSDHGQMRAVDFVVVRGGQIVASTNTASIQIV